jgi:hypothetical protein
MTKIVNCTWKAPCLYRFSGLRETADPNIRVCEACLEEVHLCSDSGEVARRREQGQRVAIELTPTRRLSALDQVGIVLLSPILVVLFVLLGVVFLIAWVVICAIGMFRRRVDA